MDSNRQEINELSEEELIARFQQTKERIYISVLYRRYEHLVYANGLKYLKHHHNAQDMVGEVFEKVILNLPSTEVQSFPAWLYRITFNACHSKLRKKNIEDSSSDNWEQVEKSGNHFMENAAVARLMSNKNKEEQLTLLNDALANLVDDQRRCVKLFFLEEKSYREIVEATGFTINKVKSMLQNGKRNLRIRLSKKMAAINLLFFFTIYLF